MTCWQPRLLGGWPASPGHYRKHGYTAAASKPDPSRSGAIRSLLTEIYLAADTCVTASDFKFITWIFARASATVGFVRYSLEIRQLL